MKPEEFNQLKPGDEIFIRARYKYIDSDGDVRFSLSVTSVFGGVAKGEGHTLPENVILPQELQPAPKYDPCRRFKKGDKVRVVDWNGRTNLRDGQVGFVVKNEESSGMVELSIDGWKNGVFYHACKLELVTPVEELEPYTLEVETAYIDDEECGMLHIYYNYNGGRDKVRTFYENGHESWNATEAAAEAECKRLNEEYRKGVYNG